MKPVKLHFKSIILSFKEVKLYIKWLDLPYLFSPIDCSVRINHKNYDFRNRFNLISEERVNFFKHNSENLMKIGWKIRKLWHFEVS